MNSSNKIGLALVGMVLLFTSCLVPGAPQYFYYKSNSLQGRDSIKIVSFPNNVEYRYYYTGINKFDSVLLHDPIGRTFQKMKLSEDASFFYFDKWKRWNLHKIKKVKTVILEKIQAGKMSYDTLYVFQPESEKVYK